MNTELREYLGTMYQQALLISCQYCPEFQNCQTFMLNYTNIKLKFRIVPDIFLPSLIRATRNLVKVETILALTGLPDEILDKASKDLDELEEYIIHMQTELNKLNIPVK